jgi:hypothetical protein
VQQGALIGIPSLPYAGSGAVIGSSMSLCANSLSTAGFWVEHGCKGWMRVHEIPLKTLL